MATILNRNNKYVVIYWYSDENGNRKQKWETFGTMEAALKRKSDVENKREDDDIILPLCRNVNELFNEYVELYGKENWAPTTYQSNVRLFSNYIQPLIGKESLESLTTRYMERYYQKLQKTPAVVNTSTGKSASRFVSTSTIQDIHKLLRSCFQQGVKWEIMDKNPCTYATTPKHKSKKRQC